MSLAVAVRKEREPNLLTKTINTFEDALILTHSCQCVPMVILEWVKYKISNILACYIRTLGLYQRNSTKKIAVEVFFV